MDNFNYEDYLSSKEKDTLKKANKLSNNLSKEFIKNNNLFNKTINEILQQWSEVHQNIINELLNLYNNMDDYSNYNFWWEYISKYFQETLNIFIKDDRIIYVGISIVLLCFTLYFIDISD